MQPNHQLPLHGPQPPDMLSHAIHAYDYASTVFGRGGLFYAGLKLAYLGMTTPCCKYATREKIVYDERGRYVHLKGCQRATPLADLRYRLWCLREGLREGLTWRAPVYDTWAEIRDHRKPEYRAALARSVMYGTPYRRPTPDELEQQRAYSKAFRDSAIKYCRERASENPKE
jgi:hypothetical protein